MLYSLGDLMNQLNGFIETHATAWWALLILFGLSALDGFFPPLPSESIVIALAAYAAAGKGPDPLLIVLFATLGAFLGDNLCYTLGRHSALRKLRHSRFGKVRAAFAWAERELGKRGGMLIFVARYIPVGRLAVNVTAGATEFPRKRFLLFDAAAALTWAGYSVGIGYLFGNWLHRQPLLASAIGICFAILAGWLIDRVLQRWFGSPAEPAAADSAAERTSDPV